MSGIVLQRAGGLSAVKQDNDRAPAKKGLWAFIWPFYELFLLGSTGPEGKTYGKDSRYHQLQREGWRKWEYEGKIWTRYEVPGCPIIRNGWYLTTGRDLQKDLGKYISECKAAVRREQKENYESFTGEELPAHKLSPEGGNPFSGAYCCDSFEVFVEDTPN